MVLRYEWTAPDRVTWTLIDSDHCDRGTGEVLIRPLDGGGSRVDVTITTPAAGDCGAGPCC